jgi:hypothetical protein
LEFWPEVPFYPDKNRKILDKVCAKIRIKFCEDGTLCRRIREPTSKNLGMSVFWFSKYLAGDDTVTASCDKYLVQYSKRRRMVAAIPDGSRKIN